MTPERFDRYVERALYHPESGFYERGGSAGRRRGDFITSPEVGPLFGAVLARALDSWWIALGRPQPFRVIEAGAGPGTLAVAIRAAGPECLSSTEYTLVERSSQQRARHHDHLPIRTTPGIGFHSRPDLPAAGGCGVVVANELLDNLPFRVGVRRNGGWNEIYVEETAGGRAEVEAAMPARDADLLNALAPGLAQGARVPLATAAVAWLRQAIDLFDSGRIVVADYGADTAELADRGTDWLRTYSAHERGSDPLGPSPGSCDITADVPFDQLVAHRAPVTATSQANFLRDHGLEDLVDEGRRIWTERAHLGDLQALAGRSRVGEAEALVDPAGLGSFSVLQWTIGPDPMVE